MTLANQTPQSKIQMDLWVDEQLKIYESKIGRELTAEEKAGRRLLLTSHYQSMKVKAMDIVIRLKQQNQLPN